jgi:hypothetical protein
MKSVKTHTKFPFGVTKKDPGLVFHFHVSKMFKCWSNLGLTNIQMSIKNSKKEKTMHIVFLCHMLTIQDDKQGVHTFKQKIHLSNVISQTLWYE